MARHIGQVASLSRWPYYSSDQEIASHIGQVVYLSHLPSKYTGQYNQTSYQNQLKQRSLVHLEEVQVIATQVVCSLLPVLVILWGRGVILVVGTPLDDLSQDGGVDIGEWYRLIILLINSKI